MVISEELLERARVAAGRLAEAEREVLVARGDYHTMIRRMHLAGASLREIAGELGLSHQRVAQIVEAEGGSWWQRIWRTRGRARRDAACTFCGGAPSEVAKLIAGPDVFVCDVCVAGAERALRGRPVAGLEVAGARARAQCSFCAKRRDADRALVVAKHATVCAECVGACRQILEDRAGG